MTTTPQSRPFWQLQVAIHQLDRLIHQTAPGGVSLSLASGEVQDVLRTVMQAHGANFVLAEEVKGKITPSQAVRVEEGVKAYIRLALEYKQHEL